MNSSMIDIKDNIAISESGLVFNPDTGESFSINPVGQTILSLMIDGKDYESIKGEIMSHYHVDDDTFEKDYQDFTRLLLQYQIAEEDGEKDD